MESNNPSSEYSIALLFIDSIRIDVQIICNNENEEERKGKREISNSRENPNEYEFSFSNKYIFMKNVKERRMGERGENWRE